MAFQLPACFTAPSGLGRGLTTVAAAFGLAANLAACTPLAGSGRMELVAAFPRAAHAPAAASRQVLVIPDGTVKIVVRVTGENIPLGTVLAATLTPDKASTLFQSVPAGMKQVDAKCYDATDAILAAGESGLAIVAGKTATAHITMLPLADGGGFQLVLQ